MKVGSIKALNKCDLGSQYVTPITASFLLSGLSYLQFFVFYLMVQSGRVSRDQSQSISIHGLSRFGPRIWKTPLGFIFQFVATKDHDFGLR